MALNTIEFRRVTSKAMINSLKNIAFPAVNKQFLAKKRQMIEEFDGHPVTKEIEAGPEGGNSSGTLGGKGNLFSFIGFEAGDNPTLTVREMLNLLTTIDKTPIIKSSGTVVRFTFPVSTPTLQDLELATPMPWEPRSWVRAIEEGISGLGHYLYWKRNLSGSRSGTAIQVKNLLRGGGYRNVKYLSEILRNFSRQVK